MKLHSLAHSRVSLAKAQVGGGAPQHQKPDTRGCRRMIISRRSLTKGQLLRLTDGDRSVIRL